jgi:hypothetical protein
MPAGAPILLPPLEIEAEEEVLERARIQAVEANAVYDAAQTGSQRSLSTFDAERLRDLMTERARRRIEALRLYEPLKVQEEFHKSHARMRLVRGSNRAGKTLSAAVEVARAVTGTDPYDKYVREDGIGFVVGKDQKHLGQVIYKKLFRPGALRIIRDKDTGEWRAFRPWDMRDALRKSEAKPAPPLIPDRYIKTIAWENKKENVPNLVKFVNGWELYFFSSLGKPPQGSVINLFWFDEELVDPNWFPETWARVTDFGGVGMWSATPQAGTDQLYELHESAERQKERGDKRPTVEEFVTLLDDNPHISDQAKKDFASTMSDEEIRVRIGGDFAVSSFKVYPEFTMLLHGLDYPMGGIPKHWTRYAAIDPGHQVCAVLFAAVPPPEEGDRVILYDELYLHECNAVMFAEGMKLKSRDGEFYAFVIDAHMGIHTELGSGRTVAEQYMTALREAGVASQTTGSGFVFGSDNVLAGISAVHSLMRVREDGTTRLKVVRDACPNLEWEIKRYHKRRDKNGVSEMPNQKKNNHLMDALRYLAMLEPKYHAPRTVKREASGAVRAYREKLRQRREQEGGSFIRLG